MKIASGDFSDMAELTKDITEGGKEGKREKKVREHSTGMQIPH